jgi:imidazolonepropionase-like amidohydrolase
MRFRVWFAALVFWVISGPAFADVTYIHAGQLLAEPGNAPLAEQTIVIEDGKIKEIIAGYATPPGEAKVVDLKAKFVLPGLIDSHVHLLSQLSSKSKIEAVEYGVPMIALRGAHNARITLDAGFTTVRDLNAGTNWETIFALREAVAKGLIPGPRILAVGTTVSPTGGHGQTYGYRRDILEFLFASPGRCDGVEVCRRVVREQVAKGADAIKLVATAGVMSDIKGGLDQQFTDEELQSIVETAHRLGRKVSAHAHGVGGINAALRAGVDSIEHGSYLDDTSIALFKEKNAYLVPTVIAGISVMEAAKTGDFLSDAQKEKALKVGVIIQDALRRAYAAGVKIAFGTDMGIGPHGQNAKELKLMVDAGMPAAEVIKAATVNAADLLGITDQAGTIVAGKSADIIAVDGNPLEDITQLERVRFVMARGTVFKSE